MESNIGFKVKNSLEGLELERLKDKIANAKGKYSKKDIEKVSKNFEAIFIYKLLKEMKGMAPESGLFGKGLGSDIFQDFLYEEYANKAAENGSIGLWEMVYDSLSKNIKLDDDIKMPEGSGIKDLKLRLNPGKEVEKYKKETIYDKVETFNTIIEDASQKFNVDSDIIKAVITQESKGDPRAVSQKGAKGLMQLMEPTAMDLGVKNAFNPVENIFAGVKYLKGFLNKYEGNLEYALASYNAGPANVERYNGVPPFKETENFINKVKYYLSVYRNRSKT